MRKTVFFTSLLIVTLALLKSGYSEVDRDTVFQVSTINALMEGVYDADTDFKTLKEHGDFGIGTFNGLDGEMAGLDGEFYQIKVDGKAYPVEDSMQTPFSLVTFFEADISRSLNSELDFARLREYLDTLLPNKNLFYAIKIKGAFRYVKARSVPMQNKPYPKLSEAAKEQKVFEFNDIKGTLEGFWCPAYIKGINMPGYHLHFLTKDRKAGGHLLGCITENVVIEIDESNGFAMILPLDKGFLEADLSQDNEAELKKVEN